MPRLRAAKKLELQAQFEKMDTNGDRKLNLKEMQDLLKKGNPDLSDEQIQKLYKAIDKNGDGSVDFEEFVDYIYQVHHTVVAAPDAVLEKFIEFAGPEMDGTEFSKFCHDCHLIDKQFRKEDLALTFAKVLPRGKRKITTSKGEDGYSQFDKLLCFIAEKKGVPPGEVHAMVSSGEKTSSGTKADDVRFHDDPDASPKAARAGKEKFDVGEDGDWMACEAIFREFNKEGNGLLDNREFIKLCVDSGLCKQCSTGEADVVFAKFKSASKKLDLNTFKDALRELARMRKVPTTDIQKIVGNCDGPKQSCTKADSVRFHDDKSLYTGTHAGK
jgi:Ca2+-binding EF-hand superfamily protein